MACLTTKVDRDSSQSLAVEKVENVCYADSRLREWESNKRPAERRRVAQKGVLVTADPTLSGRGPETGLQVGRVRMRS